MQFSYTYYISMYLNFSSITLVIFMRSRVMPNVYLLQNFITFTAICFKFCFCVCLCFSCFLAFFTVCCICACAEYWKVSNVWNFPDYLISVYGGLILSSFTYFTFSMTHTIMKVDGLSFLKVSSTLSLSIVCKLELKRFAQLLVGWSPHLLNCAWFKPNR